MCESSNDDEGDNVKEDAGSRRRREQSFQRKKKKHLTETSCPMVVEKDARQQKAERVRERGRMQRREKERRRDGCEPELRAVTLDVRAEKDGIESPA